MEDIMTPEQLAEHNMKIQEQAWLKREKLELRKLAMSYAIRIELQNGSEAIKEAEKIYDWMVTDLEPKNPLA